MSRFSVYRGYFLRQFAVGINWAWLTTKCSMLRARCRYTSDTLFGAFPLPQFEMSEE